MGRAASNYSENVHIKKGEILKIIDRAISILKIETSGLIKNGRFKRVKVKTLPKK
jgi:hypothetical protein